MRPAGFQPDDDRPQDDAEGCAAPRRLAAAGDRHLVAPGEGFDDLMDGDGAASRGAGGAGRRGAAPRSRPSGCARRPRRCCIERFRGRERGGVDALAARQPTLMPRERVGAGLHWGESGCLTRCTSLTSVEELAGAASRLGGERGRRFPRARSAGAQGAVLHQGDVPGEAGLHRRRHRRDAARGHRPARALPLHPRPLSDDVPRPDLDHAPDRGLRHRRGHQQALQVPDRAGPDRHLDRFRHADADGLRQRPPDERGRGRARGRGDRHARRHGGAARRHRPREDLGLADDQPDGVDPARHVRGARREAGLRPRQDLGDGPGGHPQGVHGAEGIHLPDRAVGPHRARHHRLLGEEPEALQPDQHLGLPHLGGRRVAAARGGLHAGEPDRLRRGGAKSSASTSTTSRRGWRSSSSPRPTSSRRSPSSARCAAATPRS
jgi:hypothetical protein